MNTSRKTRILIVDDEPDMLETCRKMLELQAYDVVTEKDSEKALKVYCAGQYDLCIIDLKMSGLSGLELMRAIQKEDPAQLVLMITAYASVENAIEAVRAGAFDFVRKPFSMNDLLIVLERALRVKALQDENRILQQKLKDSFRSEQIVGKSRSLRKALAELRKVSEVEVSVLITGESGTGKELFATAIHENSRRAEHPFVVIDCASLPENLLESELFGYEKGAFTGAVGSKRGLLETADGGTVLLDEIAEMSLNLQAKLLRTLQEKRIRRLGSGQESSIDVRVLAATNQDLEKAVQEGTFREDLYYRINVVRLSIPPLREREGDIAILAQHFFELFAGQLKKKVEGISAAALLVLEQYSWPGNVRELKNTIERACTMTESTQIVPEDLPKSILPAVHKELTIEFNSDFKRAKQKIIEDFDRGYVVAQLTRAGGNVSEAARLSGISRPAFHRLMKRYSIAGSDFKDDL